MKFTYAAALATVALAGKSMAQDLSGLPTCAEAAAIGGIGATGCAITDIKCICTSTSFLSTVSKDIMTSCSAADQAKTLAFAQKLCGSVGVTVPGASATTTAVVTSTSAAATSSEVASSSSKSSSSVEVSSSAVAPTTTAVYSAPATASTTSTSIVVPSSSSAVVYPTAGGNVTTNSTSGTGVTTGTVPSPTYVNSAAAKAAGLLFTVAVAGVAALAL